MTNEKEESLLKQLKKFYFASEWQSIFFIAYLFLFTYFSIFYVDNIFLAIRFIFRTFTVSTTLLSLSHVIWGAIFVVALSMPFIISIAMILTLPNIWKHETWKKDQKMLAIILSFALAMLLIFIADDLINAIASRDILDVFLNVNGRILEI